MNTLLLQAERCTGCAQCLQACPTRTETNDAALSPQNRMRTSALIAAGTDISRDMAASLYSCLKCMCCESVCPEQLPVARIVQAAREAFVRRGPGPLKQHTAVIEGILRNGNAANGDPAKRLDWLQEAAPHHKSETLLYLGCLASYEVQNAARATYLVLQKLDIDFMILPDEGCCGNFLYTAGHLSRAENFFRCTAQRLSDQGVRTIIVTCGGCLQCFKQLYPEVLGSRPFAVKHVVEVIHEALQQRLPLRTASDRRATYLDPCRLVRGEALIEQPRQILSSCGLTLTQNAHTGKHAACCGAGGGIRSVYPELSLNIAARLLQAAPAQEVITACPFCTYNLKYAARKKRLGKEVRYITESVLDALAVPRASPPS